MQLLGKTKMQQQYLLRTDDSCKVENSPDLTLSRIEQPKSFFIEYQLYTSFYYYFIGKKVS